MIKQTKPTFKQNIGDVARVLLAIVWTFTWGCVRYFKYACHMFPYRHHNIRQMAFSWGRRESPKAVWCPRCSWGGSLRYAVHTYTACGEDDVEPTDECPRCGMEDLEPVLRSKKGAWGS